MSLNSLFIYGIGHFSHSLLVSLVALVLILSSCSGHQYKIDAMEDQVHHAELNFSQMDAVAWEKLDFGMNELALQLEQNRRTMSETQIKEIGNLQGRYAALLAKKSAVDIKDGLNDAINQIEGFIEGISSDSF